MPFSKFHGTRRTMVTYAKSTGYIADGKEPLLPPGMKELLYEDLNKAFDF